MMWLSNGFPIVTAAELIGQLYVGYFGRAADRRVWTTG